MFSHVKGTEGAPLWQIMLLTLDEPQAGTDMPLPVSSAHFMVCEVKAFTLSLEFKNKKIPEAINNPPKNIIAGIIIFLDKNWFGTG